MAEISSLCDVTTGTGTFLRDRDHTHQPQVGSALPDTSRVSVLAEGCKHRANAAASKWFFSFDD